MKWEPTEAEVDAMAAAAVASEMIHDETDAMRSVLRAVGPLIAARTLREMADWFCGILAENGRTWCVEEMRRRAAELEATP